MTLRIACPDDPAVAVLQQALAQRPELGAYLGLLYRAVYRAFTGEQTAAAALKEVQAQALADDGAF